MGCAWLTEKAEQWDGRSGIEHALKAWPLDECPGMAISLPIVIEAARAAGWAEKGLLREFYENEPITPNVLDCIELLNGAVAECDMDDIREQRRELRRKQQQGAMNGA